MNDTALAASFPHCPPLAVIAGDLESSPVNYDEASLKDAEYLEPIALNIYAGMKVYLTRTVRRDTHDINDMAAEVSSCSGAMRSVRVRTRTNRIINGPTQIRASTI